MNLIRAELFKLRTTNIWWILGIVLVPLYAASLLLNWASNSITPDDVSGEAIAAADPITVATTLYTTGQYFGVLIVLLLSAIIVTSEFFHLTATSTFLVTPRREAVILAKFAAAAIVGLLVWAGTTLLDLALAPLVLSDLGLGVQLGEPQVWGAIGLNAVAFVLWAVLGVGVGVLIRSQIGATLTLAIVYTVGTLAATLIFGALSTFVASWFENLQVFIPTVAADLMTAGTELPGNPPRFVGALILIGWATLGGVIGTVLTKSRDVS